MNQMDSNKDDIKNLSGNEFKLNSLFERLKNYHTYSSPNKNPFQFEQSTNSNQSESRINIPIR